MRRLPPNKIEQNLNGLLNLIPEETDELLQRIDQPLKEATDPETVSHSISSVLRSGSYSATNRAENTSIAITIVMVILIDHHGRINMTLH
jgi:predicted PurR-regulated permease PerM